ncbi:sensor histidine kinase, partial [Peribacillus simplex]
MRLHTKLMLGICTLIILMGGIFEVIFINILENNLKQETGEKALSVAQTISLLPEIKQAFRTENPSVIIQPIAEKIRRQIDAEFIVIGDENETRLSHPDPNLIGKKMVGGDNGEVWNGKSIITESTGTLGPSIRGKSPIMANGKVIGVVSVGYLQDDIEKEVSRIQRNGIIPYR